MNSDIAGNSLGGGKNAADLGVMVIILRTRRHCRLLGPIELNLQVVLHALRRRQSGAATAKNRFNGSPVPRLDDQSAHSGMETEDRIL